MFSTRESYRKAWQDAYSTDPEVPLNVDIELASVCNLSCPFCFIPDPNFDSFIKTKAADGRPKARLMPMAMAFRIIDECAEIGVPAVKFNWRGESTLHPDYTEILQYARELGDLGLWPGLKEMLVNTNANCTEESFGGLMAATKVMVSLDSLVPETYAIMRRGGNLEKAKANIKRLVAFGHPNLWIRRVLAKENLNEPFARMVHDEFGDSVHVSEHYCFDRNSRAAHERPGCDHDGVEMGRTYCGYPSQRIVIASTGLCYPCCIDLHEEMPVGDITKQRLKEIWEGETMVELRRNLREGKFASKACANCESWMSHDAPQRNFVQDIEVK